VRGWIARMSGVRCDSHHYLSLFTDARNGSLILEFFGSDRRWKSHSLGGRPQIDANLPALIRRMSVERLPRQRCDFRCGHGEKNSRREFLVSSISASGPPAAGLTVF
jgi:hypothetical protein